MASTIQIILHSYNIIYVTIPLNRFSELEKVNSLEVDGFHPSPVG